MNSLQLKVILFFVERGMTIAESCKRVNKQTRAFYILANSEMKLLILRTRWEMKSLKTKYSKSYELPDLLVDEAEQLCLERLQPTISQRIEAYIGFGENYIKHSDMPYPLELRVDPKTIRAN